MTCSNCNKHIIEHCKVHAIPCCPGKCPGHAKVHDEKDVQILFNEGLFTPPSLFVPLPIYPPPVGIFGHANCRCALPEPPEPSWQAEIAAALDEHVGNTSPCLPEYSLE